MDYELRLRPGVHASVAAQSLEPLLNRGTNIASGGGGPGQIQGLQNTYLAWVEDVDRALRFHFQSSWVWEALYSARWGQIYDLTPSSPRPHPLITAG